MSNIIGWVDDPYAVELAMAELPEPMFCNAASVLKDSGKGKTVLLYPFVKQLTGTYNYQWQGTGDCVSWGAATAVDTVKATQIVLKKSFEEWKGFSAQEVIYGGSRVQIGKGRLGRGQGSLGIWAARFVSEYGTLVKGKYDQHDLRKYNTQRAIDWGYRGVPNDLLDDISEHPIQTVSRVDTVEEGRDSVANGFPVTIAGTRGFHKKRDVRGTVRVNRWDSWAHQMVITAVDDVQGKFLVENSWPRGWITGPTYLDQPEDSFWAYYEDIEFYFTKGDSWSYSDYLGYRRQELDLNIV